MRSIETMKSIDTTGSIETVRSIDTIKNIKTMRITDTIRNKSLVTIIVLLGNKFIRKNVLSKNFENYTSARFYILNFNVSCFL